MLKHVLFSFLLAICFIGVVVWAGTVTTTSSPEATGYTLTDIYNLIDNNATTTSANHDLYPSSGPASSLQSISDIYVALANLIQAENLASTSVTYLGVTGGTAEDTPEAVASITKDFTPNTVAGSVINFTLDDIYHLITDNTRISTPSQTFAPAGAPAETMHTLAEIYTELSTLISPENIATGTTYLGVTGTYEEPVATYTVTYDGNGSDGGTVPVDASSPYASSTEVTVLDNTGSLTKTDYSFTGWNTQADGGGTAYAASATFLMPAENVTLYAVWVLTPSLIVTGELAPDATGIYRENGTYDGYPKYTLAGEFSWTIWRLNTDPPWWFISTGVQVGTPPGNWGKEGDPATGDYQPNGVSGTASVGPGPTP